MFVLLPRIAISASQRSNRLALDTAEQFATEFALAQAGGADLRNIRGVRSAVQELNKGINGTGPYSKFIFRVSNISPELVEEASQFLTFDRGILRFHPPIHYEVAWTSGSAPMYRTKSPSSLSRMLAERTAQSIARVYGAARAAAADLSDVKNVEGAVSALEKGVAGAGAHATSTYSFSAVRPNIRFLAKKMLRFHEGDLHFIRGGDRIDESKGVKV